MTRKYLLSAARWVAGVAAVALATSHPAGTSGTRGPTSLFAYDRSAPLEVAWGTTTVSHNIVHNRAACYQFWRSLPANYDDPSQVDWPAESGGAAAYAEILDRFQVLRAGAPVEEATLNDDKYLWGSPSGDLVLHRLLMPERERQQREIATALERIVDLVR